MKKDFAVGTKIWMFICVVTASCFVTNYKESVIITLTGFLFLIVQRKWNIFLPFILFYSIIVLLMLGIRFYNWRMIIFSEFHVVLFWNIFPTMIISWDLIDTPPGKVSAFLSEIQVPVFIILGVLVVFRFIPTLRAELAKIRLSMKNRGLLEFEKVILHPAITAEYVLIPLLLRCIQVADQLSVSAMTRGACSPLKRSSYYENGCSKSDYLWTFIGGVMMLLIIKGL